MTLTKHILAITESVNRFRMGTEILDRPLLDTSSTLIREEGRDTFGNARVFDTFEQAANYWKVYSAGCKATLASAGWLYRPDDEDDELTLRMKKFEGGYIAEERLLIPQIYPVDIPVVE
jgi:hypothetical protein